VCPHGPQCRSHRWPQVRSSPSHSSITSTRRSPRVTGITEWGLCDTCGKRGGEGERGGGVRAVGGWCRMGKWVAYM
jgi:hypothetical protein